MSKFIVKIQISQFPLHGPVYVYSKDRTVEELFDETPELVKAVGGKKAYFWATIDDNKKLIIHDRAPWQDW